MYHILHNVMQYSKFEVKLHIACVRCSHFYTGSSKKKYHKTAVSRLYFSLLKLLTLGVHVQEGYVTVLCVCLYVSLVSTLASTSFVQGMNTSLLGLF